QSPARTQGAETATQRGEREERAGARDAAGEERPRGTSGRCAIEERVPEPEAEGRQECQPERSTRGGSSRGAARREDGARRTGDADGLQRVHGLVQQED